MTHGLPYLFRVPWVLLEMMESPDSLDFPAHLVPLAPLALAEYVQIKYNNIRFILMEMFLFLFSFYKLWLLRLQCYISKPGS